MNPDNTIYFDLNVPANLHFLLSPNEFVHVKAHKNNQGKIITEFVDTDTSLLIAVTDWYALYCIARKRAEAQWESRENAKEIGCFTVNENGKIITSAEIL